MTRKLNEQPEQIRYFGLFSQENCMYKLATYYLTCRSILENLIWRILGNVYRSQTQFYNT